MKEDSIDLEDSTLDGIKGDNIDDELEELEDILTELDAYEKKKLDEGKREQAVLPGGVRKNSALQQALQQVKDAHTRHACMHACEIQPSDAGSMHVSRSLAIAHHCQGRKHTASLPHDKRVCWVWVACDCR